MLSADFTFAVERCAPLAVSVMPKLVFMDPDFALYANESGVVRRRLVSTAPELLEEADLFQSDIDGAVRGASSWSGAELILTTGVQSVSRPCNTIKEHVFDERGHRARDVLPTDVIRDLEQSYQLTPDTNGGLTVFYHATCGGADCEPVPDQTPIMMRTEYAGNGQARDSVVALPPIDPVDVFADGNAMVLLYRPTLDTAAISRVPIGSATPDLVEVLLPLTGVDLNNELSALHGGISLGDNEYAVVYATNGGRGSQTRLTRFTIQ